MTFCPAGKASSVPPNLSVGYEGPLRGVEREEKRKGRKKVK